LAEALAGKPRHDDVALALAALLLFVVSYPLDHEGRNLVTVRDLAADQDAFLGSFIMMQELRLAGSGPLRLLGRRLSLWPEDKRAGVADALRRCLAFVSAPEK
jgi:hypothetical protein